MRAAIFFCVILVLIKIDGINGFHVPFTKIPRAVTLALVSDNNSNKAIGNNGVSNGDRNGPGGYNIDYGNIPMTSRDLNGYMQSGYDTQDEYERFLYSSQTKRRQIKQRKALQYRNLQREKEKNEDGYASMMGLKPRSWWQRILFYPLKKSIKATNTVAELISKATTGNLSGQDQPGRLILVRHGESEWNANKTFTGWADPNLSDQGVRESEHAARLLLAGGYDIDVVFTSRLKRAIRSTWIILGEINQLYLPVFKSWRLNERMYGALTGLGKTETAETLGVELVQKWRGSLKSRPPPLRPTDFYWPGRDRRYSDLSPDQIPLTESLLDCMVRTVPVWEDKIKVELQMGRNVMVVGHANTLRGLVKIIDKIGDQEIQEVAIPTGIPIVYKFDKNMNPIRHTDHGEGATLSQKHMSGVFLEKPGLLKKAMQREQEWINSVPGYDRTMARNKSPMTPLERSLYKLQAIGELGEWATQFIDPSDLEKDDGSDGNMGKPIQLLEDEAWEVGIKELVQSSNIRLDELGSGPNGSADHRSKESSKSLVSMPNMISSPCIKDIASVSKEGEIRRDPVIVLIRHGKTEHNKLGLFTGWEDAPLAPEGRTEAIEAGKLLKIHGFEFDLVYTSWLSRAIETAWLVMEQLDATWLPIIKTWRLNERMYGALTGKSKAMIAQRYGEKQFKAWRRGYTVRPPKVSSFSLDYPGNDVRYKYLNDVRVSLSESIMRSFDSGRITVHRKLPKTESLKDCMDRTIPFFTSIILPEALVEGKRLLISSSENAIRGLLMHLCEIPQEKINELEIPNGLPLIYDVKSKCIKLLDDGSDENMLERYNFGKAAPYLFRPCRDEDGNEDEECSIDLLFPSNQRTDSIVKSRNQILADVEKKRDQALTEILK